MIEENLQSQRKSKAVRPMDLDCDGHTRIKNSQKQCEGMRKRSRMLYLYSYFIPLFAWINPNPQLNPKSYPWFFVL